MNYRIGNITVAVEGNGLIAEKFREILSPLSGVDGPVDLEYRFVDELPSWSGRPFTKLDNYLVAEDRFRVASDFWLYEVQVSPEGTIVLVAPRKKNFFRRIIQSVRKSWKYFHTHGRGLYLQRLKRFVYYVAIPQLQFALLRKGCSLAHSSVIARDGKAILFPSWGGVGKTSMMSRFVENGWQFISDDLCVISDDGKTHLLPMPMHIYYFHQIHSPALVRRMRENASAFDRRLWSICGKLKDPGKVVRWLRPDEVFGRERLAEEAEIRTVVHMRRVRNADNFFIRPAQAGEVAELMTSTIINEISTLTDIAIVPNSCDGPGKMPNVGKMHQQIRDTFAGAVSGADCYILHIPEKAQPDDTYAFMQQQGLA